MIDRFALAALRPLIDGAARRAARAGLTADQITLAGFGFGMVSAILICFGFTLAALVPLLIGRALDGLDGALARLSGATERGAFLDISLDFMFYAAVPLSFAVLSPETNALPAAVLLAAFLGTGTSFLAFAVIAEKKGLKSTEYPSKSFYYLGGLTEGAETIACFAAFCLWPQYFPQIALAYAGLCLVTILTRLAAGWRMFGRQDG